MDLNELLDGYQQGVDAWLEQSKKQTAAVQKLQKAVATGNFRDLEKLRQAAGTAAETTSQRAGECGPLEFDAAHYLGPDGAFLADLQAAAEKAGVRLYERDGVIFSYPVLLRPEPDLAAVRIDKKLVSQVRPEVLAAELKKAQAKDPKAQPTRFMETLFEAYELVRARRKLDAYVDIPLTQIYKVLVLLPGAEREYTPLDFARDIYFLDTSGERQTRKGFQMSIILSNTGSRERSTKPIHFVTRDGVEKVYAAVRFTPERGEG